MEVNQHRLRFAGCQHLRFEAGARLRLALARDAPAALHPTGEAEERGSAGGLYIPSQTPGSRVCFP